VLNKEINLSKAKRNVKNDKATQKVDMFISVNLAMSAGATQG
jgi:hypothetical protein